MALNSHAGLARLTDDGLPVKLSPRQGQQPEGGHDEHRSQRFEPGQRAYPGPADAQGHEYQRCHTAQPRARYRDGGEESEAWHEPATFHDRG